MKKLGIILCAAMLMLVSACSSGNGGGSATTSTGADPENLKVAIGGQITTLDPG